MKVGIIFPAYNEEKYIAKVLKKALKIFKKDYIVVVDDGSKDRTYEIAKKYVKYVIRHERNKGKAEAIKTGIKFLLRKNVNYIIISDADMQYDVKEAKKILKELKKGMQFVMGYRDFSKIPLRHRLGNFVWRTTFNFLFSQRLRDTNCGLVGFDREAAKILVNKIYGGYILEPSMLIISIIYRLRISQVKVNVVYRKISKFFRGIRVVLGVLIFILRKGLKYRIFKILKKEIKRIL